MSSFPSRNLEVWTSSSAKDLSPINGAFCFHLVPSLMVPQTLSFLFELQGKRVDSGHFLNGFIEGMAYYNQSEPGSLYWLKSFRCSSDLFEFDLDELSQSIRQLELHTDINLTYSQVTYLANIGTGFNKPLMIIKRNSFLRGVGFEVEERAILGQSLGGGDFKVISNKVRVSQQHYSSGMGLLAGEDSISGLIDAAFMQFYLSEIFARLT